MKKKFLAVLLTAVMAVSMTACGGSSNDGAAEAPAAEGAETGEESEAAGNASADGSAFKIGLITDVGGVNDGSFNQSAWEGLQRAIADFGVEANYLESSTDADYEANMETFVDEEYDLIISVGYMLADVTRAAAEANPDRRFAIIDDASIDLDNVTCLMFKQEQASYLVGYVAGMMTEKNNIGFVLGMASDTMHPFGYGYCAGAIDANPDVTVQQINVDSFASVEGGANAANTMVTNGADIIFHAAGGTGNGVISKCQELGVSAIGVDSDQSSIAPDTIITSAMKRVDNAVYDAVESIISGSLASGVITYDLSVGGVDIAPTQDLLTDEVISAVTDVKAKIISGEITVPSTKDEFEAAYGDVYTLD